MMYIGEEAGKTERTMESVMPMLGLVLMLATPIGIVLYVALVIAIPVCRMLDWFFVSEPED
jgi:hypothetical protein